MKVGDVVVVSDSIPNRMYAGLVCRVLEVFGPPTRRRARVEIDGRLGTELICGDHLVPIDSERDAGDEDQRR